jgi:hypothetical protein
VRPEEEIIKEWEHINRLAKLEVERLPVENQTSEVSGGQDKVDGPAFDILCPEGLEELYLGTGPKPFQEIYSHNAFARHVYLQGLMHGRLLALEWVLGQSDELYPPV